MIKLLSPLAYPIGLLWLSQLAIVAVLLWKRRWRLAVLPCFVALAMWVVGATSLPYWLMQSLERPYIRADLNALPECDAVVMLGGGFRVSDYDAFHTDLTPAADRMIMALELMRLKKGKTLILGGPGVLEKGEKRPVAARLEEWFRTWGIPAAPVMNLGVCENTRVEAERTQALAKEHGWKRILLVTSAFHLRRSEAVFHKLDMECVTVGCDYQGLGGPSVEQEIDKGVKLFPTIDGFQILSLYVHEKMGWWVYAWRGWV